MPAIQPSGSISIAQIKSALGSANNDLGSYRGLNQTLPSSGPISMSDAQRLVKGVGFSTSAYTPTASNIQGYWSDTGITVTSSFSLSFWINITSTSPQFRNIVHVTTGGDSMRRPSVWILPSSTGLHITSDTSSALNEYVDTGAIGLNTTVHVVIVFNGRNRKTYYNGVLQQDINFNGVPTNNVGTEAIFSANPGYSGAYATGGFTVNRLWFYPIPLTQSQITTLYNTNNITS